MATRIGDVGCGLEEHPPAPTTQAIARIALPKARRTEFIAVISTLVPVSCTAQWLYRMTAPERRFCSVGPS
jgi:hypothetical protein